MDGEIYHGVFIGRFIGRFEGSFVGGECSNVVRTFDECIVVGLGVGLGHGTVAEN
jgi:hypothetical protein